MEEKYKSILVKESTKREFDLLKADKQLSQDEMMLLLIKNFKSKENGNERNRID